MVINRKYIKITINALFGFLIIAGFFILVGLFSVDSTPIKRHRKSTSVRSSMNYKGQFRKAHFRPAVSTNKNAIRTIQDQGIITKQEVSIGENTKINFYTPTIHYQQFEFFYY